MIARSRFPFLSLLGASLLVLAPGALIGSPAWKLVWSDEFNGPSIDRTKWEFEVNALGGYNNELQYYTDRPENARIENGCLVIEARAETYTGPGGTRNYTSARMRTLHKGDWKYGRIEVRAKLPRTQGLWPAIWMLPSENAYGGWPSSGEIDLMELLGDNPRKVYGTLHYADSRTGAHLSSGANYTLPTGTFADDFHVFALEWEPTAMRWYVDGTLYGTQTTWQTNGGPFPAPFDQTFHLLLNVAVGGNWPGNPDGTSVFPQRMVVDYVRVFRAIDVPPAAPNVLLQPVPTSVGQQANISLAVVAAGTPPLSYQWYKEETPISGATESSLTIAHAGATDGARYHAVISNSLGTTTTDSVPLTITSDPFRAPSATFTNLSSRAHVGPGDDVLIAGFVIGGSGAKRLLIRAVGPGLEGFGVPGYLADPVLTLFDAHNRPIIDNDDWTLGGDAAAVDRANRAVAFPLAAPGTDAAMIVALPAGAYTAQVSAAGGATGIALAEVYDLEPTSAARLINLSSRARVGTNADVLIAGFNVAGTGSVSALIRASGPALVPFGIVDPLPDPQLQLTTLAGTPLTANDNWSESPDAGVLAAAGKTSGAFDFSPGSKDAALLATMSSGSYTAITAGNNLGAGIALIEAYERP